jgi:hypothetical protein
MKVIESLITYAVLTGGNSVAAFVQPTTISKVVSQSESSTQLQNDLWGEPPQKSGEDGVEKSKALPFAARPKLLDGTLPGDVGFEYV